MKIYDDITGTVGRTPLVRLNRITEGCRAQVAAKVESFNPLSSVKDRIGVAMIDDAEKRGVLKKGYTISVVKTVPEKVKLTADPGVLAGITEIKTAPILLDNIEDDVEMQMPLNLPDKVLAETHSVLVKIQLEKPR